MAKTTFEERWEYLASRIPWAAVTWAIVAIVVLIGSTGTVSLRDEERFVDDFQLRLEETDDPDTYILHVVDGTFEYDVSPRVPADIETGTFTAEDTNEVAMALFAGSEEVSEVTIEPQTITVKYEGDIEGSRILRRVQRTLRQTLLNDPANLTGIVAEDQANTLVFTTTDEIFRYGRFVPNLVDEGEREVYRSREAGLDGSALAESLLKDVTGINALTIEPDRLIVTLGEGASSTRLVSLVEQSLNDFFPRASMGLELWLLTLEPNDDHFFGIQPVNTEIPLFWFALVFAGLETALFFYLFNHDNKLLMVSVRVIGIFFFFWSLYGHEPFWDYTLGLIFTNSRQVIYPNTNVIEFVAQHLELVFISSLVTIPAGLFIGIMVTRESYREILPLANNLVNSGQTVPTIAIVAFMAPIIGFGFWPAIIALIAYGMLPVVRNTIAGLEAVDDFIIDSSRGMGMTPMQILIRTELPIASAIIMAGIRTSMVINVGTATLGAFVGSGGLGTPIASGLAMTIDAFVLLGALPAAVLAILIDYILDRIEFVITPKGLQLDT